MDAKFFFKNNMSCQLITAVTLAEITLKKNLFTLPKNECTRKAWIAVLNRKEGTSVQSVSTLTSNPLLLHLLLCTAKI